MKKNYAIMNKCGKIPIPIVVDVIKGRRALQEAIKGNYKEEMGYTYMPITRRQARELRTDLTNLTSSLIGCLTKSVGSVRSD
ncbi:MAG: hypothetical protein Q7S06_01100 [Nanoarchaeota archaeon]|nr:hypothetical protein [Nanoarchaeota archaeon]